MRPRLAAQLHALLVEMAAAGQVCPGYRAIADRLGCGTTTVPGLFQQLRRQGVIRVVTRLRAVRWGGEGQVDSRVVHLLAEGTRTADPAQAEPPPPPSRSDRERARLEAAKTVLRRRAWVYDDGRLVRVDHRRLTPDEVIALADRMTAPPPATTATPFAEHYGRRTW